MNWGIQEYYGSGQAHQQLLHCTVADLNMSEYDIDRGLGSLELVISDIIYHWQFLVIKFLTSHDTGC